MRKAAALTNPKAAHTKRSPAFGGTTVREYEFVGGYPAGEASARLDNELDYQRATQAYIWATPLVNSVAFKKALVDAGPRSRDELLAERVGLSGDCS